MNLSPRLPARHRTLSSTARLGLALLLSGLAVRPAVAARLVYDLQVASVIGSGHVNGSHEVYGLVLGDVVILNMYVAVIGDDLDPSNDGYAFGYFGLGTSNAGNAVRGNLGSSFDAAGNATSGVTFNTEWHANSQPGLFGVDRNGDGGQDIGLLANATTAGSFAKARSAAAITYSGIDGAISRLGSPLLVNGSVFGVGQEFLLGTVKYFVTGDVPNDGSHALVNFVLPPNLGVTPEANWQIDGLPGARATQGSAGTPVSLAGYLSPEPSACALLVVGALGLASRRRR